MITDESTEQVAIESGEAPPVDDVPLTKKMLVDAKALIEEKGWIKGSPHLDGGGYCAGGVLAEVAYGSPWRLYDPNLQNSQVFKTFVELGEVPSLYEDTEPDEYWDEDAVTRIYSWNDNYNRKVEEVLAAFDVVIAKLPDETV